METPIYDFVKKYQEKGTVRLHMPGHKGSPFLGCEGLDITEISGADDLFHPRGIIQKSEENATKLFGARRTFYATGGSSQCIGAMLFLAMGHGRGRRVLAGRNAHKAFHHACALLDLAVEWLYPKEGTAFCACPITAAALRDTLSSMEELPFAVFITSPDYLGGMVDIAKLAGVCHDFAVPLLVDNAHGAYLKFLEPSVHPLDLGASMCCDSAHKTLPVLTGGAYLHISKAAAVPYERGGKKALALFGSTSPSYLTLQSLDLCNEYLDGGYRERLAGCIGQMKDVRRQLEEKGAKFLQGEPLKLVFDCAAMGISGEALAKRLADGNMEGEFVDQDALVLMVTPENTAEDFRRLREVFTDFVPQRPGKPKGIVPKAGARICSTREAFFARQETVSTAESVGRVCAGVVVSCPPAIPIVVGGERITQEMVELLIYYGIFEIDVMILREE